MKQEDAQSFLKQPGAVWEQVYTLRQPEQQARMVRDRKQECHLGAKAF